jgi:hypothetical protein
VPVKNGMQNRASTVMIGVIEWLAEESGRNRIRVARSTILGPEAVLAGR